MHRQSALTNSQWFQMAKTSHKISSFDMVSQVFPNKFQQIYNYFRFWGMSQNLSNRYSPKYDPSISRIFKILFLADFCNLEPLCNRARAKKNFFAASAALSITDRQRYNLHSTEHWGGSRQSYRCQVP